VLGAGLTRPRGKGVHHCAAWSDDEIRQIRHLRSTGLGYHKIRAAMGGKASWVSIQHICKGKTYTHVY
jgi:hypothetical protein